MKKLHWLARLCSVLAISLVIGCAAPVRLAGDVQADEQPVVLVGAGDVAGCESQGDEATAELLDNIPGTVFVAGDVAYSRGTAEQFANCYGPSWGRHKSRTLPAPGNHEYGTARAQGYFDYFGMAAGDPTKGYYSYDLGAWHIVALNSNCSKVGGCQTGSGQEKWLRADLEANPAKCTLAYWHHPLYSSGQHGNNVNMRDIWKALYDANAELVIAGHDHNYERFAPQDADGNLDRARGIREFVVGTGGKNYYRVGPPIANSEVREDKTFGVIRLTLYSDRYDWEFVPEAGRIFTDVGGGTCH